MTDVFREIEKGHEAKYKLDQEMRFKAQCRRNRLFGLWAAELMGMGDSNAEAYAKSLVRLNLDTPDAGTVCRKVIADLHQRGVTMTEQDVTGALNRFYGIALEQLSKDFPTALDTDHIQVGG